MPSMVRSLRLVRFLALMDGWRRRRRHGVVIMGVAGCPSSRYHISPVWFSLGCVCNSLMTEEEIETVEEEELEVEEEFTDAYIEVEEEKEETEEEYADDPDIVEQDEETVAELEDEKVEIDEMYEEYEEEVSGSTGYSAARYGRSCLAHTHTHTHTHLLITQQYAGDAAEKEEEANEEEEVEVEIIDEESETQSEFNGAIEDVAEGDTTEAQDEALQEAAQETVDNAIAVAQDEGENQTDDESGT